MHNHSISLGVPKQAHKSRELLHCGTNWLITALLQLFRPKALFGQVGLYGSTKNLDHCFKEIRINFFQEAKALLAKIIPLVLLCWSKPIQTLLSFRLESPTRSLLMEAPKGIQILAEAGDIQAICRNELRLESKDGEVSQPMDHFYQNFFRLRTKIGIKSPRNKSAQKGCSSLAFESFKYFDIFNSVQFKKLY